jgi:cell division protein FtsZ
MKEIEEAATLIQEQAHEDANIIFGASIVESMADMIKVAVIATGFNRSEHEAADLLRQATRHPLEHPVPREMRPVNVGVRHEPSHVSVAAHSNRLPLRPSARVPHTVVRPAPPQVRDHIVFPASPSDADWDVPAYQRRNGG